MDNAYVEPRANTLIRAEEVAALDLLAAAARPIHTLGTPSTAAASGPTGGELPRWPLG